MPAFVQRPAPAFKAEAVSNGEFTEVSLSDNIGKWYVLHVACALQVFLGGSDVSFSRLLGSFFCFTLCEYLRGMSAVHVPLLSHYSSSRFKGTSPLSAQREYRLFQT